MTREERKELNRYKRGIRRLNRMLKGKTIFSKMDGNLWHKLIGIVTDAKGGKR